MGTKEISKTLRKRNAYIILSTEGSKTLIRTKKNNIKDNKEPLSLSKYDPKQMKHVMFIEQKVDKKKLSPNKK
jgi:ribosomal protein L33